MIRIFVAAIGLLLAAMPSFAEKSDTPGYASAVYGYICTGGTEIDVAYINMDSGLYLAVLSIGGEIYVMDNILNDAVDAHYATSRNGERYVWRARGNEGIFLQGPEGEEEMIYSACVS